MPRLVVLFLMLLMADQCWAQLRQETLLHHGRGRSYLLALPTPRPAGPAPLAVVLHDGGASADMMQRRTSFHQQACPLGWVVVYPEALGGHWREPAAPAGVASPTSPPEIVADLDFVWACVRQLVDQGLVDPRRVHVAGLGSGGILALRLACQRPEAVAAVAVVGASLPADTTKGPSRPVPALLIHGDQDRLVPMAGGAVSPLLRRQRGLLHSGQETVALWRRANGCQPAERQRVVDQDPKDGTSVLVEADQCPAGAALTRMVIQGGGHGWPGGPLETTFAALLGPPSRELDTTAAILHFFGQQPSR